MRLKSLLCGDLGCYDAISISCGYPTCRFRGFLTYENPFLRHLEAHGLPMPHPSLLTAPPCEPMMCQADSPIEHIRLHHILHLLSKKRAPAPKITYWIVQDSPGPPDAYEETVNRRYALLCAPFSCKIPPCTGRCQNCRLRNMSYFMLDLGVPRRPSLLATREDYIVADHSAAESR